MGDGVSPGRTWRRPDCRGATIRNRAKQLRGSNTAATLTFRIEFSSTEQGEVLAHLSTGAFFNAKEVSPQSRGGHFKGLHGLAEQFFRLSLVRPPVTRDPKRVQGEMVSRQI